VGPRFTLRSVTPVERSYDDLGLTQMPVPPPPSRPASDDHLRLGAMTLLAPADSRDA